MIAKLHNDIISFKVNGENYLLDHELALREYVLRLDDINNLMSEEALTIPESKDTSRSEISTYRVFRKSRNKFSRSG